MAHLRTSRTTRRILQIASLGLAGLIAGLLSGCSSTTPRISLHTRNDTGWQTAQTFATATAGRGVAAHGMQSGRLSGAQGCAMTPCHPRLTVARTRQLPQL